jgi:hypothetical protein
MSLITITYLGAGGRYRRRNANLDGKWPLYLINQRDQMAHIVEDQPIFAAQPEVPLNTWRDLVMENPPNPPVTVQKRMMVSEDNAMWGITPEPFTDPIEHIRQRRRALQEARQAAQSAAAKAIGGSFIQQAGFLAGAVIAAAAGLLICLIVASEKFGNG